MALGRRVDTMKIHETLQLDWMEHDGTCVDFAQLSGLSACSFNDSDWVAPKTIIPMEMEPRSATCDQ